MKRLALFVLILVILSFAVDSTKTLKFNETDFIKLRPVAYDPDNQSLTYFFKYPLSSEGTWQTKYGDAGMYNTTVTVSNGRLTKAENISIIILRKFDPPVIEIYSPEAKNITVNESSSLYFNAAGRNLHNDNIFFNWYLDGKLISNDSSYTYHADYYSAGKHTVKLLANDQFASSSEIWVINVIKFDRAILLDQLPKTITVNESQLIEVSIPDFKQYGLNYSFSYPLDVNGKWQTDYNSSGKYVTNS